MWLGNALKKVVQNYTFTVATEEYAKETLTDETPILQKARVPPSVVREDRFHQLPF
jgi:hypothetical protein